MEPITPEQLARLHNHAEHYHTTPSAITLGPPHPAETPADRYWRWALDDAARTCAAVLAERARRQAEATKNGTQIFAVKKKPRRRTTGRHRKTHP